MDRRAVATENQTIFIPEAIRRLRLAELPVSGELAGRLRKMGISTLGDLAGTSLRDFQRASNRGREFFLETVRLVQQARQADLDARPGQAARPDLFPSRSGAARADKCAASADPAVPGPWPGETLFIPVEARGKPLGILPLSVRLRHILEANRFRLLGDLHRRALSQFRSFRGVGDKTLGELRDAVRAIQHEHHAAPTGPADAAAEAPPSSASPGVFFIPANLHRLKVSELPVSVRLEAALQRKRVLRLGDLHGVAVKDLAALHNCGLKTVRESIRLIERAARGEFDTAPDIPWNPAAMVQALDSLIASLPERSRRMLVLRLGGEDHGVPTLEKVGVQFGLTRQGVQQGLHLNIQKICKAGSRQLRAHLDHIETLCREKVCPLTPALVGHWLDQPPSGGRFGSVFYFRLIAELRPAIPAWPAGQDPWKGGPVPSQEMKRGLESVLRQSFQPIPLSEALRQLRLQAPCRHAQAVEFLAMLHHSRRFTVEFPKPDAPVVRLWRRAAAEVATAVLQTSELPLTPEEIQARARALFGYGAAPWGRETLRDAGAPREAKAILLLGPRSYGLRRHIRLPKRTWRRVRTDVRALLKQENRPISTTEIIRHRRFAWADQTNVQELACVLREDDLLIDLGKFLFALAEWGVEERPHVNDLIPRVLETAHRPLTATEVWAGLQQLRSVSPTGIAGCLRKHPAVRDYGSGRYGLKSWGDAVEATLEHSA